MHANLGRVWSYFKKIIFIKCFLGFWGIFLKTIFRFFFFFLTYKIDYCFLFLFLFNLKKKTKKKQNAQPSWTPKKPNNIKLQLKPNRQIQKKLNLVDLDCALQSWIKLIKPTLGVSTLPTAQLLNRGGFHACENQMMRWSRSESERMDLKNKVTNYF